VSKKKEETIAPEETEATPEEVSEEEVAAAAEEENVSEEDPLVASQEETKRNWDLYLRSRADFDNFRKRSQREKEDLAKFSNENLIREILPVLDNLERAVEHAGESDGTLLEGVTMTLEQMRKGLEKFGLVPFEAKGELFDPARHEAMGQLESDEVPPNTVLQEMQKGYLLNERLLRPALVMIAKAPAQS